MRLGIQLGLSINELDLITLGNLLDLAVLEIEANEDMENEESNKNEKNRYMTEEELETFF